MLTHSWILSLNIFRNNSELNMSKQITTLYFKGEFEDMKLHYPNLHPKGRMKQLDRTNSNFKCTYLKPGLYDWAKINRNFRNLTECLSIDKDDNQQILEQVSDLNSQNRQQEWHGEQDVQMVDAQQEERKSLEDTVDELLVKIAYLRVIKKWSVVSIWAKLKITRENISKYFYLI